MSNGNSYTKADSLLPKRMSIHSVLLQTMEGVNARNTSSVLITSHFLLAHTPDKIADRMRTKKEPTIKDLSKMVIRT